MIYIACLITLITSDFIWNSRLPRNRQKMYSKDNSWKCIQKIIVGNEQITHNFFDFQKFCAILTFFAFMARLIHGMPAEGQ